MPKGNPRNVEELLLYLENFGDAYRKEAKFYYETLVRVLRMLKFGRCPKCDARELIVWTAIGNNLPDIRCTVCGWYFKPDQEFEYAIEASGDLPWLDVVAKLHKEPER